MQIVKGELRWGSALCILCVKVSIKLRVFLKFQSVRSTSYKVRAAEVVKNDFNDFATTSIMQCDINIKHRLFSVYLTTYHNHFTLLSLFMSTFSHSV